MCRDRRSEAEFPAQQEQTFKKVVVPGLVMVVVVSGALADTISWVDSYAGMLS